MVSPSAGRSSGFLRSLFREGSALIFAALVWYAIWGGYAPTANTPEQGFHVALTIGFIALTYVGLQAVSAVTAPLGRATSHLLDLLFSLVPLAVVGYAIALNASGYQPINFYQRGVLWFGGVACFIDVVLFTWFTMRVNKLASSIVRLR
jgi:hypothetical protein